MLTNIGTNWVKETLPNEVKEAAGKNKRQGISLLHNVDFIHLADFLLKPYSTKNNNELHDKIENSKSIIDLDLEDLKTYVPKSNWQRYFNSVVECEDGFLLKRWAKLYELRCLVAHNNFLTNQEFNEIIELTDQIRIPLSEAIDKLEKIIIPEEEREQIFEYPAANLHEGIGDYLKLFNMISVKINEAYRSKCKGKENISLKNKVIALIDEKLLTIDFLGVTTTTRRV